MRNRRIFLSLFHTLSRSFCLFDPPPDLQPPPPYKSGPPFAINQALIRGEERSAEKASLPSGRGAYVPRIPSQAMRQEVFKKGGDEEAREGGREKNFCFTAQALVIEEEGARLRGRRDI